MPDLKQFEPALYQPVKAGGTKVVTLGAGTAPAICFGSGVPTISAPQGSIYLRTDGSSVATRLYVATNSAGAWTNFVSAT